MMNYYYYLPIYAIKTLTSSLYEKKNDIYYFQITLFAPEIFKFSKYGNQSIHEVINSSEI